MSQRTRARTTGATRKPSSSALPVEAEAETEAGAHAARASNATQAAPPQGGLPIESGTAALTADALARLLRAIAAEVEQNPQLAGRIAQALTSPPSGDDGERTRKRPTVSRARQEPTPDSVAEAAAETAPRSASRRFKPRVVAGAAPEAGMGIPDPFALASQLGVEGLQTLLDDLRLGSLRAIVRTHQLDPDGQHVKQNDTTKLRELILRAVASTAAG